MSIDHRSSGVAKGLAIQTCALSLLLVACGGAREAPCGDFICDPSETAESCAKDCGCGNRVANPGEQCDGPDMGGGTCMDAVQRGGTLRCNADCTFDTTACTLASCGNGIAEDDESCDGTDLGTGTCASIGYGGGALACSTDCTYDVASCCTDTCPAAGMADCIGDSVRECAMAASGCLTWQVTDCAASSEVCDSSSGTAVCTCVDRCAAVGDQRCEGATVETCTEVAGGCLDWMPTTTCATGNVCALAPSGPTCAPDVSAEDCSEPYPLSTGDNVVAWTALNADYLTSPPSCSTLSLDGPDIVLSYTAPEDGFISFTLNKPSSMRWDVVVSSATCGMVTPELACISELSGTILSTELAVEMGTTYYFYVRDTTSGSAPLDNPLLVTLDETLCSSLTPTVTALAPSVSSIPTSTQIFSADFDYPIDATQGVITLTGDMGTNLTFDLATGPGEVAVINDGKTLQIDPGIVFPDDETVTVTWTGLLDATCAKPIAAPSWAVTLTGPAYSLTEGSTVYEDACIGGTVQTLNGTNDEGRTSPFNLPAGFIFFGQPAAQVIASTNGWLSVDTSLTTNDLSNDRIPDTTTPNGLIAAYWDDLDEIEICTKEIGNTLVVQWNGLRWLTTNAVQFQAIFDATDNSIELVYGPDQQANGDEATVGIEEHNGTYGVQASFNAAGSVTANSSKKLTPN